jgi:hypothetical protein
VDLAAAVDPAVDLAAALAEAVDLAVDLAAAVDPVEAGEAEAAMAEALGAEAGQVEMDLVKADHQPQRVDRWVRRQRKENHGRQLDWALVSGFGGVFHTNRNGGFKQRKSGERMIGSVTSECRSGCQAKANKNGRWTFLVSRWIVVTGREYTDLSIIRVIRTQS